MSLPSVRQRALAMLLCLMLATPAWAPPAGAPPPPESPRLLRHLQDRASAAPPPVQGPARPRGPAATQSFSPYSRIVFQSYQGNNWEIYTADDEGNNLLRLTNNSAADTQPRLTRGADRVVFTSNRAGPPEIFSMSASGAGVTQLTASSGGDASADWSPDGSKIAFTSYRDGQAEVYVMNSDGSNQTRLTNSPDFDGQPVWSPDGQRLAFTAYRNGQWRIWVMDANGANQAQVSAQPYSEDPAWSPDGAHLAFDADTDNNGFNELWRIDLDGTHAQQLFAPGGQSDALAGSWSPNGLYVAYTWVFYVQSGGQWYWTSSLIYYAFASVGGYTCTCGLTDDWNPDWKTTDTVAPVSSIAALPATSPAHFTVHWSGSDAFSGVAGYDVETRTGAGGAWTPWLTATTDVAATASGLGGVSYYFRSRAHDGAGNLEAWPTDFDAMTTVENLPPQTQVAALPAFTSRPFTVSWGGIDPGGSGIQYYDVQYHTDTNPTWLGWFNQTTVTSFDFQYLDYGRTYYYRARGVDWAGNTEAWPAGADAQITMYSWSTTGAASDNHGTPISGVTNQLSPSPLFSGPSDVDGHFTVYGAQADSPAVYTATWAKPGYGSLPAGTVSGSANASPFQVVLPPADNVVANGGFETGALGPNAWQAAGTAAPVITSTMKHTGQYAALLGTPGLFAAPEYLTTTVVDNMRMVQTDDNALHAIWLSSWPSRTVMYITRPPSGAWSAPLSIADPAQGGSLLAVAAGSAGNVHAAWASPGGQITYRHRAPNGTWDAPVAVSAVDLSGNFGALDMAVDASGAVHVLWQTPESGLYYRRRDPAGAWGSIETVAAAPAFAPKLAVSPAGVVTVAYDPGTQLYLRQRTNGVWSAPALVPGSDNPGAIAMGLTPAGVPQLAWIGSAGPELLYSRCPGGVCLAAPEVVSATNTSEIQLAVSSDGAAHLIWVAGDAFGQVNINYARRAPNGGWDPVVVVGTDPTYTNLATTVGPDDVVHVVWGRGPYVGGVTYTQRSTGGVWTQPEVVDQRITNMMRIVADRQNGGPHLLTQGWLLMQPINVSYQGPLLAAQSGSSGLVQRVTIPVSMTAPTLSFLYEAGGLTAARPFTVTVDAGSGPVTVFSTTARANTWTHAWADLSAWSGQALTVTFGVQQAAGQQTTYAAVDEVSLGAAHPDVWVSLAGTGEAMSQALVQYTLRYGNRGPLPASGLTLTLQLDPKLQWVSSVPPAAGGALPTWTIASLPVGGSGVITITARVQSNVTLLSELTSTAHLAPAASELETLNNTANVLTEIIGRLFLPVVITN